MRKFLYIAPMLLVLAACKEQPQQQEDSPQAAVDMANPAAVYCIEQGGDIKIRDAELGQVGYCHLPDGRIIEEWEFFRTNNQPENE